MKYLFFPLLLLAFASLKAQTKIAVKHTNFLADSKAIDVEPQFPGGNKAFNSYLAKNVTYPPTASDKDIHGSVTLAMAIEPDGSITDIKIVNGLSELMDKETIRLLSTSPKWKPGMQSGQPIRVRFTFTINYAVIEAEKRPHA